ncbi:hypothetical protein BC826DRAFT_1178922 [Russula brevipes]|nr:hypothetical protein BC826DRAFT_1178922 [Russula brevipes]
MVDKSPSGAARVSSLFTLLYFVRKGPWRHNPSRIIPFALGRMLQYPYTSRTAGAPPPEAQSLDGSTNHFMHHHRMHHRITPHSPSTPQTGFAGPSPSASRTRLRHGRHSLCAPHASGLTGFYSFKTILFPFGDGCVREWLMGNKEVWKRDYSTRSLVVARSLHSSAFPSHFRGTSIFFSNMRLSTSTEIAEVASGTSEDLALLLPSSAKRWGERLFMYHGDYLGRSVFGRRIYRGVNASTLVRAGANSTWPGQGVASPIYLRICTDMTIASRPGQLGIRPQTTRKTNIDRGPTKRGGLDTRKGKAQGAHEPETETSIWFLIWQDKCPLGTPDGRKRTPRVLLPRRFSALSRGETEEMETGLDDSNGGHGEASSGDRGISAGWTDEQQGHKEARVITKY